MEKETYDYIIVGAGSAGCVMADRLSEDGKHSVLVIEAGGKDRNIWIHIPLGYGRTFFNRNVNWMFETEPQPGMQGRRIAQPRGKVVGGSSSINGLLYVRGQKEDYDGWHDLGNEGWRYEDVLPLFRRSEDQQRGENAWHGVKGPLPVSSLREPHLIADAFIEAGVAAGIPRNDDFNGAEQEGIGHFQATARNGLRKSTARTFLARALRRGNVTLATEARVTRILFDGLHADAVVFRRDGRDITVRARCEIVVAAGAIQSPQILQLSGVGPGSLLKRHGIDVVKDLGGVGANLQDHLQARLLFETRGKITINDDLASFARQIKMGLDYALFRKGPLGWWAGLAGAFIRTRPDLTRPDVQFHLYPFSTDRKDRPELHPFSAFTLTVCQLRPYSRGEVTIQSSDPLAAPLINPRYLTDPRDGQTIAVGLRVARLVAQTQPLAKLIKCERDPGPDVQSDEDLLSFLKAKAMSVYHPVGTCMMGHGPDAVVDDKLRVHGVSGLRVADASIMPTLISGNTNAPSIMIGEKASDLLREAQSQNNLRAAS
ncbi:glucose-methanol-choline oxidoreductase [Ancylobacter novellus DSM 506]|uniref:Glucose-methanol-choline oxidoreductase n=1 Tax=Ancylobacter novellus (strain ATCC 8093 / DSM 506 / JCM 20403 / CCM 1077 / IAM 12100 / NBRC 12443 / NCIMB 10456) TaxID=639283 RepID=D7A2Q8_ANCN5|nr:GMC family oxidoreductase N-terminal domain-containing protein [Ancylobacter novellus]ADH91588.1 glucose-methanol-choline oxidoreductase [Ancylobacter novellus DSM 506]